MNSADEQLYRGEKVVKRGLLTKDYSPNQEAIKEGSQRGRGSPTHLSLPTSSNDVRTPYLSTTRPWRGLDEYWAPRRHVLAIFTSLSVFALVGSFLLACSMSRTPLRLDHQGFVLPSHNSQAAAISEWERPGSEGGMMKRPRPLREAGLLPLGCNEKDAILRVYMYDLPSEFHYGMLVTPPYPAGQLWPRNVSDIPPYPGGLYQQHSPEYWLTSDLLTSNMADRRSVCTAYRVDNWRSADVMFVPFFASLSYNRFTRSEHKMGADKNQELQEKLMKFLRRQPAWVASEGSDHVIVIHHPNSGHVMRDQLRKAMFVVADFGRYESEVANIGKDVVAPYKHVVREFLDDHTSFESRKTLLYFQGAIVRKEGGIIRQQLYELIKDEPGVYFEAGNTSSGAIRTATAGMQASKFCLNLAGDTPSSNRLFDSIASHCVPVVISDDLELPFEDYVDYTKFCLFVKSSDALNRGFVINLLRGISSEEWTKMSRKLQNVDRLFKYQHPTGPDDAVHMTWKAIARKVSKVRLLLNKQRRTKLSRLKSKEYS